MGSSTGALAAGPGGGERGTCCPQIVQNAIPGVRVALHPEHDGPPLAAAAEALPPVPPPLGGALVPQLVQKAFPTSRAAPHAVQAGPPPIFAGARLGGVYEELLLYVGVAE